LAVYDRQLTDAEISWGYHWIDFMGTMALGTRIERNRPARITSTGASANGDNQ
jgi:hypothetical protein